MIILVVLTDQSLAIGDYDRVVRHAPQMARIAGLQAMDGPTSLLTGYDTKEFVLTCLHQQRLFMPRRIDGLHEAVREARNMRRGAMLVMGSQEVYEAFLPFADRVVHLCLDHPNYHKAFDGGMGFFPDLSGGNYKVAWGIQSADQYPGSFNVYPGFKQITYASTGVPHFELVPPGPIEPAVEEEEETCK